MDFVGRKQMSQVAQATFATLVSLGEATRKTLSESVGISLPTVTAALAELAASKMVLEIRREQGLRGRATLVYGVSDEAGWVLGVDIGSTQVSIIARGLNGTVLQDICVRHHGEPAAAAKLAGEHVALSAKKLGAKLSLHAVALALNQVVPRNLERVADRGSLVVDMVDAFCSTAELSAPCPILIENNVNCAAVAEHATGSLRGHDDAVYMQIGVGIGLGFFCDGALIRGGQGGSGELAQVPLSWSADVVSPRDAIEQRYGSRGLMKSALLKWPGGEAPPRLAEELFALGQMEHPIAVALMREHGVALGRIAAAAAAILDPSVMALGGGLSQNAAFAEIVIDEFRARNRDTQIELSTKGANATVEGAAILAHDLAMRSLVSQYHKPILSRPTLRASHPV